MNEITDELGRVFIAVVVRSHLFILIVILVVFLALHHLLPFRLRLPNDFRGEVFPGRLLRVVYHGQVGADALFEYSVQLALLPVDLVPSKVIVVPS